MAAARAAFVCAQCRYIAQRVRPWRPWRPAAIASPVRQLHSSAVRRATEAAQQPASPATSASTQTRSANAPKAHIDIRHIRQNPELYAENCLERNYRVQAEYPARITSLFEQWQGCQRDARALRERSNVL
ncbi:hypothetical protein Micbo1qcDRAFT_155523, partial [Microdochium bolleyi]